MMNLPPVVAILVPLIIGLIVGVILGGCLGRGSNADAWATGYCVGHRAGLLSQATMDRMDDLPSPHFVGEDACSGK